MTLCEVKSPYPARIKVNNKENKKPQHDSTHNAMATTKKAFFCYFYSTSKEENIIRETLFAPETSPERSFPSVFCVKWGKKIKYRRKLV